MFQFLTDKINQAIKKIKGQDKITAQNISSTLKEIRRALVAADVHYNIAKIFVNNVKEKALGQEIKINASPGQIFTKIVYEELVALMGEEKIDINTQGNPAIILLVGLQGAGKTTLAAKLASRLKAQNKSVLLTSCDVYRPAAIDQLGVLAKEIEVDTYLDKETKDPLSIAKKAIAHAKAHHQKVVIVDTAGRQVVDQKMMEEVVALKKLLKPQETLFVVDAMIGQSAVDTAKAFNTQVGFDGVILTKMDGDTRGGAALAIYEATKKPIKLLSTGEKMIDLDTFHPDRMANRILGMGDVLSLVERAEQVVDEEEARRLEKKLRKHRFDFNDLLIQMEQVSKMGSLKGLLSAIPGIGALMKKNPIDETIFTQFKIMVQSMTPKERSEPDSLNEQKRQRIAYGSGLGEAKVRDLIKRFEQLRKMARKGVHKQYIKQLSAQQNG